MLGETRRRKKEPTFLPLFLTIPQFHCQSECFLGTIFIPYTLSFPVEYIENKLIPDRFLEGVTQNIGHLWCQSLQNVNVCLLLSSHEGIS